MKQAGLTLVEIIIATALAVSLGYILSVILIQSNTIFLNQNSKINQGLGLNQTSAIISDSIKSASVVLASSPTSPVYTSSSNTMVLAIPSLDSSGNAIANSSDYLVITPDATLNKILRQIILPTLPQSHRLAINTVLLTDLSSISFVYQDQAGNSVSPASASRISYTVIVSEKAGLNNQQGQTSGVVNLRNI